MKILWGCEANVIDAKGNIDLEEELQQKLDIILVGFHKNCGYKDLGKEKNTIAIINALKNPNVRVLTHPTTQPYDFDFDKVIQAALKNNVLLELNLAYLTIANNKELILFKKLVDAVKKAKKKLIVNSDAHFIHEIGDDSILNKYWTTLGLTKDLIINNYPDELMKFLKK